MALKKIKTTRQNFDFTRVYIYIKFIKNVET